MDDRKTPSFLISGDVSAIDPDISDDFFRPIGNDRGDEILVVSIDIGDGRHDQLIVCENDNPEDIVFEFCERNNLNESIHFALLQQILSIIPEEASTTVTPKKIRSSMMHNGFTSATSEYTYRPKINNNSKKIVSEKTKQNVYERLYKVKANKNSKLEETSTKPKPATFNAKNESAGKQLYYRGLTLQQKTKRYVERLKKEKLEQEMREVTFKPRTNSSGGIRNKTPEIQLLKKHQESNEKIKKLKLEKRRSELEGCTFTPKTNTKRSARKLNQSADKCIELYKRSTSIQTQREKRAYEMLKLTCPFTPKIIPCPSSSKNTKRDLDFTCGKTLDEYIEEKKQYQKTDLKTNQPWFTPKTGRPPSHRDISPGNIWDYLYSKTSRSNSLEPEIKPILTDENSEKIISTIKRVRFFDIFSQLGPDESGRISSETIKKSTLQSTIRAIIDPLITELAQLNENLDFEEFYDSMNALFRRLTPGERSIILKIRKSKEIDESNKLANKSSLSRSFSASGMYEREKMRVKMLTEKFDEIRAEKQAEEIKKCTFKPNIHKWTPTNSSRRVLQS
ncbi:unnamed protein product [Blepharisma stoltei]|uniref:EF-hand domain-containing protein n=1 Tax=Blepharisma stoltei TaxID=1481888 RepID=A0AAU9JIA8_9CILI|nr:unnamed protein product [Blepharisma stoltei]